MKPQQYLTDKGKAIFHEIAKTISDKIEDIDTYELSMLANAYDVYHRSAQKVNDSIEEGKAIEINRLTGVMDKAWRQIEKQSDKFGMNPIGRDKLNKIKPKDEEPKNPLAKFD